MLAIFQRCLPELCDVPVRVASCRLLGAPRRMRGRVRVAWNVTTRGSSRNGRGFTVVGTGPVTADYLGPEIMRLCREAAGHPATAPFARMATHLAELELALVIFPVDPGLHGLVDITGRRAAEVLSPHLVECRRGARVKSVRWELSRYEPCRRCELRTTVPLTWSEGEGVRRICVKAFADHRGRQEYENLESVWRAASGSGALRVPEPLGYDDERRLLIMSEVPAPTGLPLWIRQIERQGSAHKNGHAGQLDLAITTLVTALGELQASNLQLRDERTFRSELARLHRHADRLKAIHPVAATTIKEVLDKLSVASIEEDVLVPAHGSLRPGRVTGTDERMTIFGWDRLCMSSPALDAATFIARLRQAPIQRPGHATALEETAEQVRVAALQHLAVNALDLSVYEAIVLLRHAVGILRHHGNGTGGPARARKIIWAASQCAVRSGL